jgi:adenine-specific DNA-methyltransferase
LLDELFGRNCFVASNVWQKRYSRENREAIGDVHEYVLTYAMNPGRFKELRHLVPPTAEQTKVYRNPNNDPRGPWRPIPMTAQEGHATKEQFYEIVSPTGAVFRPPNGRCWSLSKATFERLRAEGRIYFGKAGDSQPNVIRYLTEVEGYVPWTWWPHDEVGHTDESKNEIHALFGKTDAFDTPKPERLIHRILTIATSPGDLVFDSFLGSGTTAAVAHKMGRRWIGVEVGEHAHTLCVPRLTKVIEGTDPGGITNAVQWKGGGGFRYFRLAPSLLEKDAWGNWVISKEFDAAKLSQAVCKLMGFAYHPDETHYWMQGRSSETDFIYVTTQNLTHRQLAAISEEVGDKRTLLVCCKAFRADADAFPNLTIKKLPQAVLRKCEWGHDDYSLNVANLPMAEALPEAPSGPNAADKPPKGGKKRAKGTDVTSGDLFSEGSAK